ncbi:MAG: tetratricopeptide repeat protein [Pseudomonadota bacterium]|nr:tetratricopeptide repeat protein [Pseudomonadota bacterium]
MKVKLWAALLISTTISVSAMAGLPEAIKAFDKAEYKTAYPEMMALASEGNSTAAYYMGKMYHDGLGVEADIAKAIQYFEQADKGYYSEATVQLGKMALAGEGMAQNQDLGIEYLKKAAYAGNGNAMYELGSLYEKGEGVEKNYTHAFGFFYMGALKGEKRSQVKTARYYLNGRGIPQDFKAAVKWYVRAANQGYIPAQQEWADIRASHPRLKNPVDAFSWYSILAAYNSDDIGRMAAERRDTIGRKFDGNFLAVQQKKIMNWRPVSAERSVPQKERIMAVMPIIPGFNDEETTKARLESGAAWQSDGSGYGITAQMISTAVETKDKSGLEKKIESAVQNGNKKAYAYYGDLLRSRFQDDTSAVQWYRKGSDLNDPYAQYQLGKSYCEGRGINPPDISECYGWMLTANSMASDPNLIFTLKNAITSIEGGATEEELKTGKAKAEERKEKRLAEQEKPQKKSGLFNIF